MTMERELPLELFEPPPGGLEALRARFAEPLSGRPSPGLVAFGVAALATLAVLLIYVPAERPVGVAADTPMLAAPELDRLLGREARPMPLTVRRDDQQVQTEELPSTDPQVRIYRVL